MNGFFSQRCKIGVLSLLLVIGFAASPAAAEDVLELLSGAVVRGTVVARSESDVTIQSTIAGQAVTRKFPLNRIHALTVGGKREVIQAKSETSPVGKPIAVPTATAAAPVDPQNRRTREQVLAEIERAGRTPPDWFAAAPLSYPPTLDLSWPPKPSGGWNNQVNVGQYLWDVINPNPGRWPSGIKLLHHLLTLHQNNPETLERTRLAIAKIYYSHLSDYARAAYWYRVVGAENTEVFTNSAINLAECYYHLGNKDMAAELLRRVGDTNGAVKAWTTLGEIDTALQMSQRLLNGGADSQTLMYAGDACRISGRYDEALQYYRQIATLSVAGNNNRLRRDQARAQENVNAIQLFEKSDVARVPDGVYTAQSLGYEGQVVVEVAVANKRITGVRVVRHGEKQYYSSLVEMPQRILAKQSVKGVDTVSDATLTSEAIINATAKALAGAAR